MVDSMKELKDAAGELGITLNVKNLHLHMDERMTNNTYYPGTRCGDDDSEDDSQYPDPFDEYMGQGDWDEDEEEPDDEEEVSVEKACGCGHCSDCSESLVHIRGNDTHSPDNDAQSPVEIKVATTVGDLAACIHDKTDIGLSTIYRVLECFFDSCDECVEFERKCQEKRALKAEENSVKKGAAYED